MTGTWFEVVVAAIGVVLAGVIGLALWRLRRGRRRIGYRVQMDTPVGSDAGYGGDRGLWLGLFGGEPAWPDASLALLRIGNDGSGSISMDDYTSREVYGLYGLAAEFTGRTIRSVALAELGSGPHLEAHFAPQPGLRYDGGTLHIPRVPLGRGEYFKLLVLLTGGRVGDEIRVHGGLRGGRVVPDSPQNKGLWAALSAAPAGLWLLVSLLPLALLSPGLLLGFYAAPELLPILTVVAVVAVSLGLVARARRDGTATPRMFPGSAPRIFPGRDHPATRRIVLACAGVAVVAGLLVIGALGADRVLSGVERHGSLGPSEAPALVVTITSLSTAVGLLIGTGCLAVSRLWRARGAEDRDHGEAQRARAEGEAVVMQARAELMRAEADLIRARNGLPAEPEDPDAPGAPAIGGPQPLRPLRPGAGQPDEPAATPPDPQPSPRP